MRTLSWTCVLLAACAGFARAQEKTDETAPKTPEVGAAVERAFALLLDKQESLDEKSKVKNEWPYEGVYREGGDIPIGYRIGGTAFCAWALIETPQFEASKDAHAAVQRALDFVLDELGDGRMSAGFNKNYDVRGWGHTYALQLLLRMRAEGLIDKKDKQRVDDQIKALIRILQKTEIVDGGGWNYARPGGGEKAAPASPFMTAPTLLALFEARAQGEKVDADVVTRALDGLEHSRSLDGAIPYNTSSSRDEWPGAIGRSPISEVTLYVAGRGSVDNIRRALDKFFENWEWLEKRRKQNGTHVPPYDIAPYYVFYAHGYAGLAIEFLPEAERAKYREQLLARLWQVREESGGWNDRIFARSENFGTAMGLLALLAPTWTKPSSWSASAPGK